MDKESKPMKRLRLLTPVLTLALALGVKGEEWTKTWTVGQQPELRIEAGDASIEIEGTEGNSIKARLTTEGIPIGPSGVEVIEHQSGNSVEVRLREHESHFNLGHRSRSIKLQLTVPHQLTANVRTGDGSISLRSVEGTLGMNTGDGSIEGASLGGDLNAHTGDGSMHIEGKFNGLRLTTGDGSIQARALLGSKVNAEWELRSGDGSITLSVPKELSADLRLRTGDGHIQANLPITVMGVQSEHEISGKVNGGGAMISVHTGDGSITIDPS
jgi:DUF4097 and DUF4098 domain-containing protein YvlB